MEHLKREVIVTNDGSSSLFVPDLNEHYHSIHGAKQEAEHVFLKMGLDFFETSNLRVFEFGFGTGLNALLTALYARNKRVNIDYVSAEKYPLTTEEVLAVNFGKLTNEQSLFQGLHDAIWEQKVLITDVFSLTKLKIDVSTAALPAGFDVVFFDAFAPNKQPDLWTVVIFEKMFEILNPGGVLVTYCCQGQARRNMIAAGFEVEKVQGPPGKREMLRAKKS